MNVTTSGFSAFDSLTGGLPSAKDYLLYGAVGTGKSSFALSFIYAGLQHDESAVLISRRAPHAVIGQARAMGHDLEPYLRSGQLVLLEYPAELEQEDFSLQDGAVTFEDFQGLLEGASVSRLVFDPVTPLLGGTAGAPSSLRARSLMQAFAGLGATSLYIVDVPEGEAHLAACKDAAYGVLGFERDVEGEVKLLHVERLPGLDTAQSHLGFAVAAGEGLVEREYRGTEDSAFWGTSGGSEFMPPSASRSFPEWRVMPRSAGPAKSADRSGRWTIIAVDPDEDRRRSLRTALDSSAAVVEAAGPAECLSLMQSAHPDVMILAQETTGVGATDMTRKLRRSGIDIPIVITGGHLRRASDRVRNLQAGADLVLERPLDIRLLKLHLRNLLARSGRQRMRPRHNVASFNVIAEPRREAVFCTRDLDQFQRRLQAEVAYSTEANQPFVVLSFFVPKRLDLAEDLASVLTFVSRRDDLTFAGERGAAVLLAEAVDSESFLLRFEEHWKSSAMPSLKCRMFDGDEKFLEHTVAELNEMLGTRGAQPAPQPLLAVAAAAGEGGTYRNGTHAMERAGR